MAYLQEIKQLYKDRKEQIVKRLNEFKLIWDRNDEAIFAELCFCLLTPQSKAEVCDDIICKLKASGLLLKGNAEQLRPYLKRARFYKNKTKYLLEARGLFSDKSKISIKDKLAAADIKEIRDWLVINVKGIGYKEASHFLRNIGFGEDLAILDIHILRNLSRLGVIKDIPKSITKKKYMEIEDKLRHFSRKIKIPMSHLDLLFWSHETNKIFK